MIGKTLAHYEITGQLGKGGMGEVYRARDTKLDREVAIKVLPREMSGDPERLARFDREARTLATLQHTNVASIYGFEDVDGVRFLVMELVEGEDLSQRLQQGPLPLDEAVDIARQIAAGLEAAHDQGIVHRDLKPANVKITPLGLVKVLDFGLARAFHGEAEEQANPMNSPTITAAMTQPGIVLGTAAYMSPEQARGKPVDRRADIWAFGVLVHEMICGNRLFAGETVSDTLAGVLKTEIDLSDLPKDCPPKLRRLLERCLDRDQISRLRDIGEARITLENPLGEARTEATAPAAGNRNLLLVLGAVAGILVGAALMWSLKPSADPVAPEREVRFSIPRINQGPPRSALSPDGMRLLYISENKLWIREMRSMETRPVAGTEGALVCAWSPNGEWIAFAHQGEIFKVRPEGSNRTRLCEIETDIHAWAGSLDWTEDDRVVFATGDAGLFSVGSSGGDVKVLLPPAEGETDFHHIYVLPGDRGFLFHPHVDLGFSSIDIYTGSERRELLNMDGQSLNGAIYSAGHIVFSRIPDNTGVWAVPFSLETLDVTGDPFLLIPDARFATASRGGDISYVPRSRLLVQIVRLDARGMITEEIGDPINDGSHLAVSPDGRQAALLVEDQAYEVWIIDLESGNRQRLHSSKDIIRDLNWTPDGEGLIFAAGSNLTMHQEVRLLDGSPATNIDIRGEDPTQSRDGRTLLLTVWNEANEESVGYVDLEDPDLEPTMIAATGFSESNPVLSPDDRFVAYESLESGNREIVVRSFPDGKKRWDVSRDGGLNPVWSAAGDRLYFVNPSNSRLMAVDVMEGSGRFSAPYLAFEMDLVRYLNARPDGSFIALKHLAGEEDGSYEIWLNWAQSLGK